MRETHSGTWIFPQHVGLRPESLRNSPGIFEHHSPFHLQDVTIWVVQALHFLSAALATLMLLQAYFQTWIPISEMKQICSSLNKIKHRPHPGCVLFLSYLVWFWMEKIVWISGQACKLLVLAHFGSLTVKFDNVWNIGQSATSWVYAVPETTEWPLLTKGHVSIGWGLPPCFPGPVLALFRQNPEQITAHLGSPIGPISRSVIQGLPQTGFSLPSTHVWTTCSLITPCCFYTLCPFSFFLFFFFFFGPVCFSLDFSALPDVVWILCKGVPPVRERDWSSFRDRGCMSPLAKCSRPSEFSHFPFPEKAFCQGGNPGI